MTLRYRSVGTAHLTEVGDPKQPGSHEVLPKMWSKINWVPILQLARMNPRMTKQKWKDWVKGAEVGKASLEMAIIKMWDDPKYDDLDDAGWEQQIKGINTSRMKWEDVEGQEFHTSLDGREKWLIRESE